MNYLFIHGIISSQLAQAVCRTLLHSIWQGLLTAAISAIIILSTRKTKAVIRYNLLSFAFVCFILGAAITFLHQLNVATIPATDKVIQFVQENNVAINNVNDNHWMPALHRDKFYQPVIYYADKYASLITAVWLFFFFLQMVHMTTGLHYANRLTRRQVIAPPHEWQEQLRLLKESLGIRVLVSLMESGLVKVPVVVGILKPVILVPLGMLTHLSPRQAEAVLLHELAHVRRRDFAMNILQRIAESFFFFNPFIIWLSARIREEREACCDDIVMRHIQDKRSYLEALISFRQPGLLSYGTAMTLGQKSNLLYRVKRMITQENKKLNAMEKLTLIFVLVAATAISFMPEQKQQEKKDKVATAKEEGRQPLSNKVVEKSFDKTLTRDEFSGDTLPETQHITFKIYSSTINDDGTTKKCEATAKGSDGRTYSYHLVNEEIKELSIDGEKVPSQDYGRYKGLIDAMESARLEMISKSALKVQKDISALKELQEHKELLNEKLLQMQNDQLVDLKRKQEFLLEKQKLSDPDNLKLVENENLLQKNKYSDLLNESKESRELLDKKLAAQDNQLQLLKEMQNKAELPESKEFNTKKELLAAQDEQFHDTNYQLSEIIAELAEAGVIADKNNFSFILNNDELIVDGKKQSAGLHESLRQKYIKHKKDYFRYKAKPNSRSTDVYVE